MGAGSTRFAVGARRVKPMTAQLIRAVRRQVEDYVLINLALVVTLGDRLGRPLPELGIPEWAICIRMARVGERREVTEHVEQIAAIA